MYTVNIRKYRKIRNDNYSKIIIIKNNMKVKMYFLWYYGELKHNIPYFMQKIKTTYFYLDKTKTNLHTSGSVYHVHFHINYMIFIFCNEFYDE